MSRTRIDSADTVHTAITMIPESGAQTLLTGMNWTRQLLVEMRTVRNTAEGWVSVRPKNIRKSETLLMYISWIQGRATVVRAMRQYPNRFETSNLLMDCNLHFLYKKMRIQEHGFSIKKLMFWSVWILTTAEMFSAICFISGLSISLTELTEERASITIQSRESMWIPSYVEIVNSVCFGL
jgi:hypothetical protein